MARIFTTLIMLHRLHRSVGSRLPAEDGATAAEYGILMGFIAFAIIAGATAVGVNLNDFFIQQATTIAGW